MKVILFRSKTIASTIIVILLTMSQSCILSNKIIEKDDVVYSTKRIELKYVCKDRDRKSPLLYLEQSVIKEIKSNYELSYRIYDILVLSSESFTLENKVFLIIDDEVYHMTIDNIEYENVKSISEKKEDVMKADSTMVSVVTGYSENNRKITRFSYTVTEEVVSKIKNSNDLRFRYYSGPNMLTVRLTNRNLKLLKQLIIK